VSENTLEKSACGALIVLALFATGASCRSESHPAPPSSEKAGFVLAGATIAGVGARDIEIRDGKIVKVGDVSKDAERIDLSGRFIAPAVIDSHVHLAYLPRAEELATGGVAGVVDLASPKSFLGISHPPLTVVASGPMITAKSGYPTQSWGRDGYGYEVSDATSANAAIDELFSLGARVNKLPVTEPPTLDDATLAAAVAHAHEKGMKVASHALDDSEAARAAKAGVDVLAHTPVETLGETTLAAWKNRAVVSTLSAFGGETARQNLAALRSRGVRVLYGTDFGNTTVLGPSKSELAELSSAGLDGKAVLAACTSVPADYWGFTTLGAIEPGKAASLLVLDSDPIVDPTVLASPSEVYIDGVRRD
jgi:imidazolonepropionase-like amidohydrolase